MGTTFSHGMQVSAQGEDDESQKMLLGRRIGDTHVDRALMSKWFCSCVENHGEECTPKIRKQQPGFKLRVIDVYGRCVIEASEGCSYVALSYVWGVSTQLCLVKEQYARLEEAGGLADRHADVPNTVKDAMYLCEQLGERYLWVDSLCIKQDDRLDRRRQIDNMDQVYSCATLTIVVSRTTVITISFCPWCNIFIGLIMYVIWTHQNIARICFDTLCFLFQPALRITTMSLF